MAPTNDASTKDSAHAPAQTCWVLSDGSAGMEVQCLGLAEALGLKPLVKRLQITRPWRWLAPRFVPNPLSSIGPKGDQIEPPWPGLVISCGRQSVAPALAIRKSSGGRTFAVHIQNPMVNLSRFDVIVAPRHDRLQGPNVIQTTGGLNQITAQRLQHEAGRFGARIAHLPQPRVAVLIGGNNKAYRLTKALAQRLGQDLAEMSRREGAGLLITPSRRTGTGIVSALRSALAGCPAEIWDGTGENPYFAYLALADAFVVTGDSVNMVTEAASTGKPVYIVELEGGSAKFRRFHESLRQAGVTRPFEGRLETWSYAALRDTEEVAVEIRRRIAARGD